MLQTQLRKRENMVVLETHARLVNDEENGCRIEDQRLESETTHNLCDNSCQRKVAGVYSSLTIQFINILSLDVIQVPDGRNYFQSC